MNGHSSKSAKDRGRTARVKEESPDEDRKVPKPTKRSRSRERHSERRDRSRDGERRRERSRDRYNSARQKESWKKDRDRAGRKDDDRRDPRRGMFGTLSFCLLLQDQLTDDLLDDRRRSRSRSPASTKQGRHRHRSPPRGPHSTRSPSRLGTAKHSGRDSPSLPPSRQSAQSSTALSAPSATSGKRQVDQDTSIRLDPARPAKSEEELEELMQKAMGFGDFKTTKNTKVPGNDKLYAVRKEKKTEYRQYMNRVGGFNRPLSPT